MEKRRIHIYNICARGRRGLHRLAAGLLLCAAVCGCVDFDHATREITARVQLQLPDAFAGAGSEGHEVSMSNGTRRLAAVTDAAGVAVFEGLTPDVYDISCAWKLTAEEYRTLTDDPQAVSGATASAAVSATLIDTDGQTVVLPAIVSTDRDIVIGKVYYAGSKDLNNRNYMAGKYVELYNQSDDSVDVAGLYLGLVEAESTQAYTLENLHNDYADSVVLLKQVFRLPDDEPWRVAPGGTVLIVNSAIDHTPNDTLESNLLDADFEAKDATGRTQNNPATRALQLVYSMYAAVSNMNLVQSGPCSVVIFRTGDDVAQWPRTYAYGKTSGMEWILCPRRCIVDGVECLRLTSKTPAVDVATKRLPAEIDAGYVNINAISGWNGEVVYRKTLTTGAAGQRILTDTNNSANDFQTSASIKPREYDDVGDGQAAARKD